MLAILQILLYQSIKQIFYVYRNGVVVLEIPSAVMSKFHRKVLSYEEITSKNVYIIAFPGTDAS